jgi:hypothetical protein
MRLFSRFNILILAFFLALIPLNADAAQGAIGKSYQTILTLLRQAGVDRVGAFRLDEFERRALRIRWHSINGQPDSVNSGERASAYFRKNEVFISRDLPSYALAALPHLELHEALGATGYDDRNYALSSTLVKLAGLNSSAEISEVLKQLEASPRMRFAGGSSVVGGGDLTALQFKQNVLSRIASQGGYWKTAQFSSLYLQINFEPVRDPQQSRVSLNFRQASRQAGQLTIFVPVAWAERSSENRQAVEDEIARKIMDVFSRGPSDDRDVRDIQDAIGRKGRSTKISPDETDYSLTAGEAAGRKELKEAGFYYFACSFHYEGQRLERRIVIAANASIQSSIEWGLDPGSTLRGTIGVYPGGKIVSTSIFYRAQSGATPRVQNGRVVGDRSASTSLEVDGKTVEFSCDRER